MSKVKDALCSTSRTSLSSSAIMIAARLYVGKLGFVLAEDTPILKQKKRWVTIHPTNARHTPSIDSRPART